MTVPILRIVRDKSLHRFWLEFDDGPDWHGNYFGVTAIDLADALLLINRWNQVGSARPIAPVPAPARVIEDVDVSTLAGHVLVNMNPPIRRGVWYPPTPLA
jgi:hypothetical protein